MRTNELDRLDENESFKAKLEWFKKQLIHQYMARYRNNISEVSRQTGLSRVTIYKLLKD